MELYNSYEDCANVYSTWGGGGGGGGLSMYR